MEILNILGTLWPVFAGLAGSIVALIIWLVRLGDSMAEAQKDISANREAIKAVEKSYQSLTSDLLKELSKVKESLARLEGALHIPKRAES